MFWTSALFLVLMPAPACVWAGPGQGHCAPHKACARIQLRDDEQTAAWEHALGVTGKDVMRKLEMLSTFLQAVPDTWQWDAWTQDKEGACRDACYVLLSSDAHARKAFYLQLSSECGTEHTQMSWPESLSGCRCFIRLQCLHEKPGGKSRRAHASAYTHMHDRLPGRAVVISVIDNLVKGASGQAMQ
eukprot:scaffold97001_cov19-Tisochrysis_lutea.AAC.2